MPQSAIQNGVIDPGKLVQRVNFQTGSLATGATTIPRDNTIPQISEGNQFMTLAITPTSATNTLQIDVVCYITEQTNAGSSSVAGGALFQDATSNSLKAGWTSIHDDPVVAAPIVFSHRMVAGTSSSTTFRVRGGLDSGTTVFNGVVGGAQLYGGAAASSITITELAI